MEEELHAVENERPVIGRRISLLRDRKGWTQAALAEALGVSQNHVSQMETGRRSVPDRLKRLLADVLGTSVPYLVGDVDESSPDYLDFVAKMAPLAKNLCNNEYRNGIDERLNRLVAATEKCDPSLLAINLRSTVKNLGQMDNIDKEFLSSMLEWALKRIRGEEAEIPGSPVKDDF